MAPMAEYNLAYVAVDAARNVQAVKYSPALWAKADQAYREGQEHFKKEDFKAALRAFVRAKMYAERAENMSRLKRFETGEGVL